MKRLVRLAVACGLVLSVVGWSDARGFEQAAYAGGPRRMPPPSGATVFRPPPPPRRGPQPNGPSGGCGANALVSADASTLSSRQAEPSAASDPHNRSVEVAAYADSVVDSIPGVSRTTDGGACWSAPSGSGPLLPSPPGLAWGSRSAAGQVAGGDASVAWGLGDTVYYGTLGFQDNAAPPTAGVCGVGGLYVYKSVDRGTTWSAPSAAVAPNTQTVFRDKGYVAADATILSPHAGSVYVTWDDDEYLGCPQDFATNFSDRRIMFSRSTDGGATWSAPLALASGCLVAPVPAVGVDGSVYVVWFDCNGGDRELVRKSTDGGGSFAPAVVAGAGTLSPRAGDANCPNPLPGASFRAGSPFPTIATDPTSPNRVYVTWFSCPNDATAHADVYLSASQDGGSTWSPLPIRVNGDAGNTRDQFFPWTVVDDNGAVRVMFGDDRLDTVNTDGRLYDIFLAKSTNHGVSFGANVRVTTQSSDPNNDGSGGSFIGDYFGMASCGTPIWTDTRNLNDDIYAAAPSPPCAASVGGVAETAQLAVPAASSSGSGIRRYLVYALLVGSASVIGGASRLRRRSVREIADRE